MKAFVILVLVSYANILFAKNYYVNSSAKKSLQIGTIQNEWSSLELVNKYMSVFKGGDTIFFKRGEVYFGKLIITCSGVVNKPIVFMGYGQSIVAPIFQYDTTNVTAVKNKTIIKIFNAHDVIINNITLTDNSMDNDNHEQEAHVAYGIELMNTNRISINYIIISKLGIGIGIDGDNTTIKNCSIKNLRMIVNTKQEKDDDFGAVAVVVNGCNNTIANNEIIDCWATSEDYRFDGGGIEIFGDTIKNLLIENNIVLNCNGFIECGSHCNGYCENIIIQKNILLNNGMLCYLHQLGNFKIRVNNIMFVNNVIIENLQQFTKPNFIVGIRNTHQLSNLNIVLSKNIFWIQTPVTLFANIKDALALQHYQNTFFTTKKLLGFAIHSSEKWYVLTADASFKSNATILQQMQANNTSVPFYLSFIPN